MPRPRIVEAILRPAHLVENFARARVRIADPSALPEACHQLNVGLTSFILRGDNHLKQLEAIHSKLAAIGGGDFRYLAGLRNYLSQNPEALDMFWSLTSKAPQRDDPVIIALHDAAQALPQLRFMMDTPSDDAPADEMIRFLAQIAAASFGAGIRRYRLEREHEGRRRSALFGQVVISAYVSLTGRAPAFSRAPETARHPGKISGPLFEFLRCFYASLPERLPSGMADAMSDEMLDPSSETLADWIRSFRGAGRGNRQRIRHRGATGSHRPTRTQ
jgi:hypothetical protein